MVQGSQINIHWIRITHELWNMYIAATPLGLCYVGTDSASERCANKQTNPEGEFPCAINWARSELTVRVVHRNGSHNYR